MNRISRSLILAVAAIALLFAPCVSAQGVQTEASLAPQSTPQKETRLKLAEGEYRLQKKSGEELVELKGGWILWQTSQGTYEVEDTLRSSAEGKPVHMSSFFVLTQGFHPVTTRFSLNHLHEGEPCKDQVALDFDATEFRALDNGKTQRLRVSGPYDLFFPTPWIMGSIILRAKENGNRDTQVQLLQPDFEYAEEEATDSEEAPMTLGRVRFLGRGFVSARGNIWTADKYQLDAGGSSSVVVWLSEDGIVLAMEIPEEPEWRIEPVSYKKLRDFAPASAPGS
jgi:hypothetical protein